MLSGCYHIRNDRSFAAHIGTRRVRAQREECITGCFSSSYVLAWVPQRSLLQIDGNEFPKYQIVCFSNTIPCLQYCYCSLPKHSGCSRAGGKRRGGKIASQAALTNRYSVLAQVPFWQQPASTHIISINFPSLQGLPTMDIVTGSLMASS
jgi:hypothetical protein